MEGGNFGGNKPPVVVEANTLPNHKTKVEMVVPAAAVAMAVAEGFNYYCQETKLSKRGEPDKQQGSYGLQKICELSQAQWWQGLAAAKNMFYPMLMCKKLKDCICD